MSCLVGTLVSGPSDPFTVRVVLMVQVLIVAGALGPRLGSLTLATVVDYEAVFDYAGPSRQ